MSLGDKICLVAVVGIMWSSYNYIQHKQEQAEAQARLRSADSLRREERLHERQNVLVMGVDQLVEVDNGQRTDTMFVMMFDPKRRVCSLLNVPRDTRVQVANRNGRVIYDKINAAYTYGGTKNAMQAVEEFLGVQIDNYLMIDVSGFKRVVDAIGGVDLYVEKDMKYDDFKQGLHIDLKAGQQHLDGEQAMGYVRYRKEYGDIGRIRRQQRFLWAVQKKIVSGQMLMKIPGLTKELMSMVRTNLSPTDILPMARTLYDMIRENSFHMSVVPGRAEYMYDIGYWTPYVYEMRKMVADLQGVPFEGRLQEAAEILDAEYGKTVEEGRAWQQQHDLEAWEAKHRPAEEVKLLPQADSGAETAVEERTETKVSEENTKQPEEKKEKHKHHSKRKKNKK